MSDEMAGRVPEDGIPDHDPALDAMMSQWIHSTADSLDVEGALAQVNARRVADAVVAGCDALATRRAQREMMRAAPLWQRSTFRAAAALIVIIGVTALWRSTRTPAAESFVTTTGTSKAIHLADGTEIHLGPASRVTLDADFGGAHRSVTLQGEAWFKVSHDASKPFAIRVGTTTVEDIGTAFMVRESPSRAVSVRVAEGAVRLTTRATAHDSTVTLRAGDGAVATPIGITVAAGAVSPTERVALAAGRLSFNDASLVEVQDALHRWYGIRLIVGDRALASRHVTADFTGEPVSRVSAVLGLTLGVHAESRGDTIELHGAAGVPTRP